MDRYIGTISRGIRAPIIREGDDIVLITVDSVLTAAKNEPFDLYDRDVIAVTEAVVARAQGNYATIHQIADDVRRKFGEATLGVTFPILSRNRFGMILKGIALGVKKIVLLLSYPADEVGNHLIDLDQLDEHHIDPYLDVFTEAEFCQMFGRPKHHFTGVDYLAYYRGLIEAAGCEAEIILANDCRAVLKHTDSVLCCDIHSRARSKRLLKAAGAKNVLGLDDLLTSPVDSSGFNPDYGLLGSNIADDERVKLLPRNCKPIVNAIQAAYRKATGKHAEVMVYGDGAFKDPVGKIWELADPVVSPGFTEGLRGQPSEVKLKYLADNDFKHLSGDALQAAVTEYIRNKAEDLTGTMATEGTTPRYLADLVGTLSDLTSGSGDKGTPIVLVQRYFDNYTQ